jgi:hypothetical protein
MLVHFPCLYHLVHPIHVLNCDQVLLEVIVEELVVTTECKDLLLFELPNDQLFHLLVGQAPLIVHLLDLGDCALRI